MKSITQLTILISIILFFSCSSNKTNIQVEIPTELQNNKEVVEYINNYAESIINFKNIVNKLGVLNQKGASKPVNMSNFDMIKITLKMANATSEIEEYKTQRIEIDKNLSQNQIDALNAICHELDAQFGQLGMNTVGIDSSEIAAINKKNKEKKARGDSLTKALDELRGGPLQSNSSNDELPVIPTIVIMAVVIGSILFFGIRSFVKNIKGTVQNLSYSSGAIKDATQDLLDDPKKVTGKDKELSKEEKENLEQLLNVFNKK